jgi:hypothetical protein
VTEEQLLPPFTTIGWLATSSPAESAKVTGYQFAETEDSIGVL